MKQVQFGFCVPIFANPGQASFRAPCYERLDARTTLDAVVEAERLGYDSCWVADHLVLGRDGAILECWTTLAALAGMTSRIRLGTIHLCNGFRHPALVAKMAATLDQISGGRLIFFVDPGGREKEFTSYGIPWDADPSVRIARMREGTELIKKMWTEPGPVTYRGEHYRVLDVLCEPKPLQQPHPPIWMGEAARGMLEAAAALADGWNSVPATVESYRQKLAALEAVCRERGRDFASIEKTLETQVLIAPTRAAVERTFGRINELARADLGLAGDARPEDYEREFAIGTPEEVAGRFQAYTALGVTHFMLWFMDFPALDGLRLFAERVMPRFRGR